MTHAELQERLMTLDDPGLPASQREGLLAHVAACGECAGLLRQLQSATDALARASGPASSEAFVESVMRRLPERAAPKASPQHWGVPVWLIPRLGVALAVVILIALVVPQQEPSLSTETLLLARAPEGSAWEFSSDTPDAALLLGFTTESP